MQLTNSNQRLKNPKTSWVLESAPQISKASNPSSCTTVQGRTDKSRAALGLILMEASFASGYEEEAWYRCGVFVAKPSEEWKGSTCGGLKIFDDLKEETIQVK
jgi:hypothetical protein